MKNNFRKRPEIKRKHKTNSEITSDGVRLIGRGEPLRRKRSYSYQ